MYTVIFIHQGLSYSEHHLLNESINIKRDLYYYFYKFQISDYICENKKNVSSVFTLCIESGRLERIVDLISEYIFWISEYTFWQLSISF